MGASPVATAPTGLQVVSSPDGKPIALGTLKQTIAPPLRFIQEFKARSVTEVVAADVGRAFIFDFGQKWLASCA